MPAPSLAELLAESARRRSAQDPLSYIPHRPHPRQAEFLALTCQEALYGGAAGGGKSDALLMAALQYVHVPGYSALLLRRTYQDLALPGAIMDRASEWLSGTPAKWNGTDKRWTFPSGAVLSFGYLDTERDKYRYASAEFQFIGWDELTQFPESWYRFLFSRLRKLADVDIPTRVRAATNPGGLGHEWVKRTFIDATDGPPFIPARLEDNPSVDQEDYLANLSRLDEATRRQLREGVWVRDVGGLVYRFSDERNVIAQPPECTRMLLALDFGFTDATAFVIVGWRAHDSRAYILRAWKQRGLTPGDVGDIVRGLEREHHFDRIVGDIGGLGKGYVEEARKRFQVPIEAAEKTNKRGYIDLMNGAFERGEIQVAANGCDELIEEWRELPWTDDRSKESSGFDNHCADAALYGWRAANAFLELPADVVPVPGTRAAYEAEAERMIAERIREVNQGEDDAAWQNF